MVRQKKNLGHQVLKKRLDDFMMSILAGQSNSLAALSIFL